MGIIMQNTGIFVNNIHKHLFQQHSDHYALKNTFAIVFRYLTVIKSLVPCYLSFLLFY